jgi:glycosyltransferase involved in cell wall biosynthesis
MQPAKYIFVDSGSNDRTFELLPSSSILHHFTGSEFSYSAALNEGMKYVLTDYVLIVSSHTVLENPHSIGYALNLLSSNEEIGAAYFVHKNDGELRYRVIDKSTFDGYNGLWNTCALVKSSLLNKRGFRPEVFTAEDQEWARWLLYEENKKTARIEGAGMSNQRNSNAVKHGLRKNLNEHVSVAYFANRKLLGCINLIRVASRIIRPTRKLGVEERLFNFLLLWELLACQFRMPKYKSKYF